MTKIKKILRKIMLILTLIIILGGIAFGILIHFDKIEQEKQYQIKIKEENKLESQRMEQKRKENKWKAQQMEQERKENIIDDKTREELRKKFDSKEDRKKIEEITKKIKKEKRNAELYYKRGELYSYVYENKKAYSDYTKAIELNPNKGLYYVGRAIIYKDNEIKKAEEDIAKALELSDDLETYKATGVYYAIKDEYESAIEMYKKALLMKLSDKETMDLYERLEDVYNLNFNATELLELSEINIERFPKNFKGYYYKAEAYQMVYDAVSSGDIEKGYANREIINAYTEGIKKASKKSRLYLGRGNWYYSFGEYSIAEKDYIEAIKLAEDSSDKIMAYYNIAVLYDEIGKKDEAVKYYKKTIDEDINRSENCEKSDSIESCKALIKIYDMNKDTENMKKYELLLKELEKYHRILNEDSRGN